jgi:hypothetical protein
MSDGVGQRSEVRSQGIGPARFRRRTSYVRLTCLLEVLLVVSIVQAEAAQEPRTIAPPKVLNIVRQTLKRGAAANYAAVEASIVSGYRKARIPMYWICLQATANPSAILYLNVYNAESDAERAAETYRTTVRQHRNLVRLQERLQTYAASAPLNMLTTRRDEFVYRRRDVDFATMGALRMTVFHVRAGHEGEFVEAARTGRAVPWAIYEDSATSTFFLLTPLRTASERDPGIPRALRGLRGVYTVERPATYALRPAMSHAPPAYGTANPRLRVPSQ